MRIIIITILFGSSIISNAQKIDTICISTIKAKNLIVLAEQKKVLDTLVITLNSRINQKDSIISLLKSTNTNSQIIINTMADQRHISETELAIANKRLKKQKRKKFWASVGGVVGIGAAFWLGLTL